MKKYMLLGLLLAITLCLVWQWPSAHATVLYSGSCGENLTWELDDGNILTISGTGDMENFSDSVSQNPAPWSAYSKTILHVVIQEGVTSVGSYAFSDCSALQSVSIADSVTRIREYSFSGCTALKDITIPDSVTAISREAFQNCSSLTVVTIPDSVTLICESAFSHCAGLMRVTIGPGVTRIEAHAFSYCNSLQDLIFMGPAPTISSPLLTGTTINAHYPHDDTSWTASVMHHYGGFITWEPFDPLCDHVLEESVLSAPTCTEPGRVRHACSCGYSYTDYSAAANGHEILTEEVPRTCTQDGYRLDTCTVCGEILVDEVYTATGHIYENGACTLCGEEVPEWMTQQDHCGPQLRWTLDKNGTLTISGTGEMGDFKVSYHADSSPWAQYKADILRVVIEEGATNIGDSAFENCENLTSVSIPDSVTVIGQRAFKNCGALTEVDLGNGLIAMEKEALRECKALLTVTLPESLTGIGQLAFAFCENLRYLHIPDNVSSLGEQAFAGSGLVYIFLPDSITGINHATFHGCDYLWHIMYRDTGHPASELYRASHLHCTGDEIALGRTEPTCTDTGTLFISCTLCMSARPVVLPATPHHWKDATCTQPRTCNICLATEGKPLGSDHVWDEGTVIQEPTDDQVGIRQHRCKICSETKVELIEKEPEAPAEPDKPLSGGAMFAIIIGSLVALIGGTGLLIWARQRKA